MLRKILIATLGAAGLLAAAPAQPVQAAGGGHIEHVNWSFEGVFGTFDNDQLQRGWMIWRDYCAMCHSLDYFAFRNLEQIGFSEDEVKEIAAGYTITDGPDDTGEMFERDGIPADYWPAPYANDEEATFINGALPPDMSVITKGRVGGPDYVYSYLLGFEDEAPEGESVPPGSYWNSAAHMAVKMPPQMFEEMVIYEDGTDETVEQHAKDVTAFLHWVAEPNLNDRHGIGIVTMLFLLVLTALLYALKKQIWSRVDH